jgi:hypothetical protein
MTHSGHVFDSRIFFFDHVTWTPEHRLYSAGKYCWVMDTILRILFVVCSLGINLIKIIHLESTGLS